MPLTERPAVWGKPLAFPQVGLCASSTRPPTAPIYRRELPTPAGMLRLLCHIRMPEEAPEDENGEK